MNARRFIRSPRRRVAAATSAFDAESVAVFKLIPTRTLSVVRTGRSAGFAPLKILSTKIADRTIKISNIGSVGQKEARLRQLFLIEAAGSRFLKAISAIWPR